MVVVDVVAGTFAPFFPDPIATIVSGDGEGVVLAPDKGLALFSARAIAMAGRGVPQEQLLHSAQLWNPPPAFTVSVNPRKEWMQMYDEAMRNMRDAFYDPNMHGVDWAATTETYRPLVYKMTHKVRSIHWSPLRPRSRGERRSLRTLPGASLRPHLAFNPRP